MACLTGVGWAGDLPAFPADGLRTFLSAVVDGEARLPRHFSQELEPLANRSGNGAVLPTLTVVAGKLGDNRCVYQFRIETWVLSEPSSAAATEPTGGRSMVKQAPCDSLVQEVTAVAEYEFNALAGRVIRGAPRANNHQREAVVAAVREAFEGQPGANATTYVARTLAARVNLRAAPSLKAPVRATLAPSSELALIATARSDWYSVRNRGGFVHRSALQSLAPTTETESEAQPIIVANVGKAYVPVRDEPSISGRVVARLSPGSEVRLYADAQGWSRLANESGYIPTNALSPSAVGPLSVAGATRVRLQR